jgi:hypothetical protein
LDDFDFNARKLALRLKDFGIKPGFNTAKTARGYRLDHLHDAFGRYLRPDPSKPSKTPSDLHEPSDGHNAPDGCTRPGENKRPDETADQTLFRTDGTVPDNPSAKNCRTCGAPLWAPQSIERGVCGKCVA